eukprot:5862064-Prymnesium_polylepis.1
MGGELDTFPAKALAACLQDLEEMMQTQQRSQSVFDDAEEAQRKASEGVEELRLKVLTGDAAQEELEDAQIALTESTKA